MKETKKAGMTCLFLAAGFLLLPLSVLLLMTADGSGSEPVPVPATEEKAYEYQLVCSELGSPWDMVMLTDVIRAYEEGEGDIESYNPIITALEFCRLREEKFVLETHEKEDGATESKWVSKGVTYYEAADAILDYAGCNRKNLSYRDGAGFLVALQEAAEKKGNSRVRYETALENCPEEGYPDVLSGYGGLKETDARGVIDLYEARYLPILYGYDAYMEEDPDWSGESCDLPEVITGDVTREELLQVAASLMNWPYLLGGKSAHKGMPSGPLDCSGYVDWVYVQCFGATIGNGGGTVAQFYNTEPVREGELLPGDLGFMKDPKDVKAGSYNHVGIYIGKIGGQNAWIHCGGSSFGYEGRPKGRVGISVDSGSNQENPILGGTFSPAMKGCRFRYYRRPRFEFAEEREEEEDEETVSSEKGGIHAALQPGMCLTSVPGAAAGAGAGQRRDQQCQGV